MISRSSLSDIIFKEQQLRKSSTATEEEKSDDFTFKKFAPLFLGLVLSVFLVSLDLTIISPALPAIASSFQALSQIAWVATAYLLADNALQPLYATISDLYGRRATLLFSLFAFSVGSLMCGLAPTFLLLVVGRLIQGVGGSGLYILAYIIISDIVPLKQRGTYQASFTGVYMVSSIFGPIIGGWLTDSVSWRWNFYLNLPICLVVFILIMTCFPTLPLTPLASLNSKEKLKLVDFTGITLLFAACASFLVGLEWATKQYAWSHPMVWGLLLATLIMSVAFVWVETKAKNPVMPLHIYRIRNVWLSCVLNFLGGIPLFGLPVYIPIYYQVAHGYGATASGLSLLSYMLASVVITVLAGYLVVRKNLYKPFIFTGFVLLLVVFILLGVRLGKAGRIEEYAYMALTGLGIGLFLEPVLLVALASASDDKAAAVVGLCAFWQSTGGIVGLALIDLFFDQFFYHRLTRILTPTLAAAVGETLQVLQGLPPLQKQQVIELYVMTMRYGWLAIYIPVIVLGCGFSLLLTEAKVERAKSESKLEELLEKS